MTEEKRRIPIWEHPAGTSPGGVDSGAAGAPFFVPDPRTTPAPDGGPGSEPASETPERPATVEGDGAAGDDAAGDTDDTADTADDAAGAPPGAGAAIAALTAERDAFYDQLLRQRAEFENFRRRTQKEMSDAEARARGRLLGEFLPILDNLDRALSAAEHHEEGKVLQGVRMTHTLFEDLLRREGVTAIDPVGEPFDPAVHEAMVFAPSEHPEGVVTATLERGYVVGDRLLRPARVAVSAGADGGAGT